MWNRVITSSVHVLTLSLSADISSFKFDSSVSTPRFDVLIGTILDSGLVGDGEDAASKDETFDTEYPGDNGRGADGADLDIDEGDRLIGSAMDSDEDGDGQDGDGDGEAVEDVVTAGRQQGVGRHYIHSILRVRVHTIRLAYTQPLKCTSLSTHYGKN
ncbi:hypothetical protein PISMIDRAFT_17987 [Pisolithus microcarpus 441]|uniref:Uncharacterized protein n=1 Tax=Pisolithus microcarpus 441 TaxID=765257 RepID=A0A0C9XM56_9AGAM|nr:hypothetical protein PISMIDRAFT_17987 [Pisolithus microcarpus 441]